MRALAVIVLVLCGSACAVLEPQVGCLQVESGTGTPCPREAAVEAAQDAPVDAGVDRRAPDASKTASDASEAAAVTDAEE